MNIRHCFDSEFLYILASTRGCTNTCLHGKMWDGAFEEIFMTRIDFPVKYDFCVR